MDSDSSQAKNFRDHEENSIPGTPAAHLPTLALIHETLNETGDACRIDIQMFLSRLVDKVFCVRNVGKKDTGFVVVSGKKVLLPYHIATPLALAISELLTNLAKHAHSDEKKGKIHITSKIDKTGTYEIVIRDERVFSSEAWNTEKPAAMDLAVVREIVELQLGGEILIERGEETAFRMRFRTEGFGLGSAFHKPTIRQPRPVSRKIMLVEDECAISFELQTLLKKLGYTVSHAVPSGELALKVIEENLPDLVLMDIELKGEMDGVEASEKIQRQWDIPIIFLSSFIESHQERISKLPRPYGSLSKPFDPVVLAETIERFLPETLTM